MSTLVALTYAEVRSVSALPAFLRLSISTIGAARRSAGNRGVRVRARTPLRWFTMTAWRDDDALARFVHGPAHRAAMRQAARVTRSTGFDRITIDGPLSDLSWRDAYGRLTGGPADA